MNESPPVCPPEQCTSPPAIDQAVRSQPDESDRELARLAKALGHPVRVRIVRILLRRKMCICGELVGAVPLAQSTVSQHLKVLRQAGVIEASNDGPRVCYQMAPAALDRLKTLVSDLG